MSPQSQTPPHTRSSLHDAGNVSAAINAAVSMDQTTCIAPPPIIFLLLTLLTTLSATGLLCLAVMTDHWEIIRWDRNLLNHLTSNNTSNELYWHLDEKVAQLSFARHGRTDNIFLVPMRGGIWTLCIDLSESEMRQLGPYGFPNAVKCISYLAENTEINASEEYSQHGSYQAIRRPSMRMQNLSISCSLVCLIILGSAALLGAFGICQRQISAILVTGVMYLLAALFAMFTLMIVHFKRHQNRPLTEADFEFGILEGLIARRGDARMAQNLLDARLFITSWSLSLGWVGVILCGITYFLWIMLSKIMRYNPMLALLI